MTEQLGVQESTGQNAVFVDLRIGKIAQTSKEEKPGFFPASTKNKAGEIFKFFAKPYDFISGYIKDIRWHSHELDSGAKIQGWNINIDTGEQDYILSVKNKDRPFHRMMSVLCAIDFSQPVRFVGFMGKRPNTDKKQKVLLLYQGGEKPVQPLYQERWLGNVLIDKIKDGMELTDDEKNSVAYDDNGEIDQDYPYIRQNRDDTWSFNDWTNFLMDRMEEDVIPAVKNAVEQRTKVQEDAQVDYVEEFVEERNKDIPTLDEDEEDTIPF